MYTLDKSNHRVHYSSVFITKRVRKDVLILFWAASACILAQLKIIYMLSEVFLSQISIGCGITMVANKKL